MIRQLIREMLIQEDEATRRMNANLATHLATKVREPTDRRMFGRVLKDAWRKEADHASFNNVTFIHWQSFNKIVELINNPRGRDEISALPYVNPPWKPFSLGWGDRGVGVILKGRPTLIANADLNSNAYRKVAATMGGSVEKMDQRQRSSGWNKYPGMRSPGSEPDFYDSLTDEVARSWEDHLVYSADEIAPAEKINFNAAHVFAPSRQQGTRMMGWPEALVDNWRVEGIVIPNALIQEWGIDETLDNLKRHEVPAGIPIYDENGEERSETR